MFTPEAYDAWYRTPRGAWIGNREFAVLRRLLGPEATGSLLDVGCGTGYFSRRFSDSGMKVTGLDPDPDMIEYARRQRDGIPFLQGNAEALPFSAGDFDYVSAIASLCFVDNPEQAIAEMWRVCRKGVLLGLLHRNSLLCRQKAGSGGYASARWDNLKDVGRWTQNLLPRVRQQKSHSAILFPGGSALARLAEVVFYRFVPLSGFLKGGFLAVYLEKSEAFVKT